MPKKIFFYRHTFIINNHVFHPRFESEQLVDLTTRYIKSWFKKPDHLLEIGVGSGVIALSLKNVLPTWKIDAVDINEQALENTKLNQRTLNLMINCWKSDLFQKIKKKYSVIIANLPYLKTGGTVSQAVLDQDPYSALFGGENGLKYIEAFLKQVKKFLKPRFLIAIEIGHRQKQAVLDLVKKYLPDVCALAQKDYNQLDRFIFIYNYVAEKSNKNH